MKPNARIIRSLATIIFVLAAGAATTAATRPVHFGLARSVPADSATVHALSEVRLWFTEAPAEGTVAIRLVGPGGDPVPTDDPVRDAEDAKVFSVRLTTAPAPGAYRVAWRGMGADGHVVRGELSFTVAAH